MQINKISALLAATAIATPCQIPATQTKASIEIASQATSMRRMRHLLAATPALAPMGMYVGQLEEKWQFPSDHLPIGMTLDGVRFASWNVLDDEYMDWVTEKDSQGLVRSMIVDEHVFIEGKQITVRDQHVIDLICKMVNDRQILCLQECNQAFNKELKAQLPEYFELLECYGESVLVDRRQFEIVETKNITGIFSQSPERTLQEVLLRRQDNGQLIRLFNSHLPGDPAAPGRFEFAKHLAATFDPSVTTIAMGDMNFNELEMQDALTQAQAQFELYSPYCTNITPFVYNSKCIDHFIVYSPENSTVVVSQPDEVMPNLSETVSLLQK